MSTRSGKTTKRIVVEENYKGFDIIKVKVTNYWFYAGYYRNTIDKIETYFTFCAHGNSNRPSMEYDTRSATLSEIKEKIDYFIKDDTIYFTEAERNKYVIVPNRKCDYGYGYDSLMKIMREHQKADKRMKILLEDRLVDANFHSASLYLSECDYEGFEKFVANDCKFHEKFEIYTHTMRKRIKDPKRFEEGLAKVITDYLASQGVKETEVNVRYIEDW